jgi:predicted alpha/beta superfamily hydrolase
LQSALPRASLIDTEVRDFPSAIMGVDYQVTAWFPPSYLSGDRKFPVIYLLDGDLFFGLVNGIISGFVWGQVLPECLVIGVGHKINNSDEWWQLRGVDFNPPENPQVTYPQWMEPFNERKAPQFLEFLKSELIPFIESIYRADPDDRCLAGYSLAGQFSIYTIFHAPGLFQKHFAGSGFWEHMLPDYRSYMDRYARLDSPLSASVFFSVCSNEDDQYPYFPKFLAMLSDYKFEGLRYSSAVIEGENHSSGMAAAYLRGLRELYSPTADEP